MGSKAVASSGHDREILTSTAAATLRSEVAVYSSDRDWANILPEILTSIARLLCPLDYSNFSGVCTSWASIASPANAMPRPLPLRLRKRQPFLLLSGDECERGESCNLFDFSTNSYHTIDSLPEIRAKWFIGSQFGWLAVIDELSNPSLLNPFTRSQIELPPFTTLPDVKPIYDSEGTLAGCTLAGDRFGDMNLSLQEFRISFGRRKLVFSNPSGGDFAVVALYNQSLIFVRPGEGKWNQWDPQHTTIVLDVIYSDGKFLALATTGDVHVVDVSSPSNPLKDSILFAPSVNAGQYSLTRNIEGYLVDLNGVLLHVKRYSKEVGYRYLLLYVTSSLGNVLAEKELHLF